jgi:hypothetical protein
MKFWTVEFYQPFFDVDTIDVAKRMLATLVPYKPPDFLQNRRWHLRAQSENPRVPSVEPEQPEGAPDLYGPVWICTTLWMCLSIVGNLTGKLAHDAKDRKAALISPWSYDFTSVVVAVATVYGFVAGMSLIVWGLMKWKEVPVTLIDTLCLYGYSMTHFFIACVVCTVPYAAVQWIACLGSGLYSMVFLLVNFWFLWRQSLNKIWFTSVVLLVSIAHLALTLAFKLYFFNYAI